MRRLAFLLLLVLVSAFAHAQGSPPKASADQPYTVEYYYKTKWGFQEEFLRLFKKNHYPILKRQVEMGRIVRLEMHAPEDHMTEDARWDYRVTIVFKNAAVLHSNFDEAALVKQMYPDQATFQKEEQRRFEVLLAHWDLPIAPVDLEKAP